MLECLVRDPLRGAVLIQRHHYRYVLFRFFVTGPRASEIRFPAAITRSRPLAYLSTCTAMVSTMSPLSACLSSSYKASADK